MAEFLLETEGYDISELKDKELGEKLKATMEEEVRQMEYASRPEVREKIINDVLETNGICSEQRGETNES